MKKIICVFLAAVMLLSMFGCGSKPQPASEPAPEASASPAPAENTDEPKTTSSPEDSGSGSGFDVDTGLFSVTITVPASFIDEGTTQDSLDQKVKESGFKSATLNPDGSVTYVMTKHQHDKMMDELRSTIEDSLAELCDGETYPHFVKVEHNDDYTVFKLTTSTQELTLEESFATLIFMIYGGMYNAFSGAEFDNIQILFIDENTGNVYDEFNSSDMGE